MAKVSAVICCANSATTLPAAIASVHWADELVIVDSGSTDDTAAIARAGADGYHVEPWRGYAGQKIFALTLVKNDWVFILDGDEEVSAVLANQIDSLTDAELAGLDVVSVRRQNWVLGRRVRAWFPDWQARLIHKQRAVWEEDALHDTCHPSKPGRSRRLSGHLEHKRVVTSGEDSRRGAAGDFRGPATWSDYFSGQRLDERLMLVARQMHERGKRATFLSLWLRPWGAFFKFYILKRGFLDGTFGLLIAQKAAVSVQLKYAALWAIQNEPTAPPRFDGEGYDSDKSYRPPPPPSRLGDGT